MAILKSFSCELLAYMYTLLLKAAIPFILASYLERKWLPTMTHMLATLLTSVDKQEQDITMQFIRLNIEVTI